MKKNDNIKGIVSLVFNDEINVVPSTSFNFDDLMM